MLNHFKRKQLREFRCAFLHDPTSPRHGRFANGNFGCGGGVFDTAEGRIAFGTIRQEYGIDSTYLCAELESLVATMKTSRNLGLAAVVVFVISHFLPAYGGGSGFACFGVCWNTLWGHDTEILSGGWFYYSGFVISNILFLVLVPALFLSKKCSKFRSVVSVVIFLDVLSWLVLHFLQQPPEINEIKIGYYLWLIAYGLLVAGHLRKGSIQSLESTPLAHSVV